jgi:hypothetical protein
MLEYNLSNILKKKVFHFILQNGRLKYICENKWSVFMCLKAQIYIF